MPGEKGKLAPWIPTPMRVVRKALELAWVNRCDTLYDLGSGDGRVVVTAAAEYGVRKAVGVEIDDVLAELARANAREKGVADRVLILEEDFFRVPLGEATVVYLYLYMSINEALKPKLEKELEPGARVVTIDFPVPGWTPVRIKRLLDEAGIPRTIRVYMLGISNHPPLSERITVTKALRALLGKCSGQQGREKDSRGS